MSVEIRTISEGSEIAELIDDVEKVGGTLRLQIGRSRYVVLREDSGDEDDPQDYDPPLVSDTAKIWENYDPDRVLRALHESAGAFRGIDRDQLLADLAEQRGQDSSGRPANS